MFFISFFSTFIDRFAPCVLFHCTMWAHQFTVTSSCTYTNVRVVIDVLVVVYNKTWENRVMLSLHGLAPSVNISADIQHYLIMTQWITLQRLSLLDLCQAVKYISWLHITYGYVFTFGFLPPPYKHVLAHYNSYSSSGLFVIKSSVSTYRWFYDK